MVDNRYIMDWEIQMKENIDTIIKDELKIIEQKTNLNPKIIIFVLGIALILSGIRVLGPYMISLIGILCPIYLYLVY